MIGLICYSLWSQLSPVDFQFLPCVTGCFRSGLELYYELFPVAVMLFMYWMMEFIWRLTLSADSGLWMCCCMRFLSPSVQEMTIREAELCTARHYRHKCSSVDSTQSNRQHLFRTPAQFDKGVRIWQEEVIRCNAVSIFHFSKETKKTCKFSINWWCFTVKAFKKCVCVCVWFISGISRGSARHFEHDDLGCSHNNILKGWTIFKMCVFHSSSCKTWEDLAGRNP